MNELTEKKQNFPVQSGDETMPVPAPGKTLYITKDTKGFDYRSILGQVERQVLNFINQTPAYHIVASILMDRFPFGHHEC